MRLVLGRYYKDNDRHTSTKAVWCIVGVCHSERNASETLYMGVRVATNPVQDKAGQFFLTSDPKGACSFSLGGDWFTQEGLALRHAEPSNPSVLRLVEMVVPEDPNAPGAVDQLASLPTPEQKSDMPF